MHKNNCKCYVSFVSSTIQTGLHFNLFSYKKGNAIIKINDAQQNDILKSALVILRYNNVYCQS